MCLTVWDGHRADGIRGVTQSSLTVLGWTYYLTSKTLRPVPKALQVSKKNQNYLSKGLEETAVNTFQNPQTHHCDRSTSKGSQKRCLHLQTEALSMIQIKEEQYSQYVGMLYWVALKMWPLCSSTWRIKVGWWEKGASAQPAAKWRDEHT